MATRITVNPEIHFGKPCIAGTRIPVVDVLELLAGGLTFDAILADYFPDLTPEDIEACLRYAIEVMGAEELRRAFVNVESGRHRIRSLRSTS